MCGVYAEIVLRGKPLPHHGAAPFLRHRGPNAAGEQLSSTEWFSARLVQTRLSIVDQRDLPVPFHYEYLGLTLAYNGEIYNWRELRAELSDGTPWQSDCDAEVIARAWRRWGPKMLSRFNGMFALVLVDSRDSVVFAARDRAGEKPLYWRYYQDSLVFASEIKALPGPRRDAPCPDADVLEFDCGVSTPIEGVFSIPPASCVLLSWPGDLLQFTPRRWWTLPESTGHARPYADYFEEVLETFVDAVKLRTNTDVPITALVSGGLDSAMIQAVTKFERVYCCTFPDDGVDCMSLARKAAPGAEVVPVEFGKLQAEHAFEQIAYHLDTPATWSSLGLWFLSDAAAADGYKIVVSGEGSDELFAGYTRYRALWWLDQMQADPNLDGYASTVSRLLFSGQTTELLAQLLDRSPGGQSRDAAQTLISQSGTTLVGRMKRTEWHTTMQVLLRMADRMTSAFSLENRAPFLDHRLIELGMAGQIEHQMTKRGTKTVLRDVAETLGVTHEITRATSKRGLIVPWNQWYAVGGERGAFDRTHFRTAAVAAWRKTMEIQTQ